jgi:predicted Zn-dependent protease
MVAVEVSAERRWPSLAWLVRDWPMVFRRHRVGGRAEPEREALQRAATVRYHLGRGRRARESGNFDAACSEARRAIDENPGNPWSYALLGQCLRRRRQPDLVEARRALERACALDPTNGYFVRLLLDVLDAQGDAAAREDALSWAWWSGAPVDRWLPAGPHLRRLDDAPVRAHARVPLSAEPHRADVREEALV